MKGCFVESKRRFRNSKRRLGQAKGCFENMKSQDSLNKEKNKKSKTRNAINKLLKRKKDMAENTEETQEQLDQKDTQTANNSDTAEQTPNTEEQNEVSEEQKDTVESMGKKLEELNKKYLLLYSDFENYRKRTAKERLELVLNAAESTIKDLLPVVDDYERALQNLERQEGELFAKTKEGLELVYNKLMTTLSKQGLKPMNAKGEKFDENIHEAIARIPAQKEEEKGIVVDETTKGYYLNDKVIRYAKVVVAM